MVRAGVFKTYTVSEGETRRLGQRLGRRLAPGAIVALKGDLGAGKTVFAAGILKGLGASGPFRSPTFTLVWEHQGRGTMIHHVDLYRLEADDVITDLPWDRLLDTGSVCLIEWADKLPRGFLPKRTIDVTIERMNAARRRLVFWRQAGDIPTL